MPSVLLRATLLLAAALLAVVQVRPAPASRPQDDHDVTQWEAIVERFEARDARRPPSDGSVLFVGSSSVRLWKSLVDDMAPMPVINRGFGGARTDDVLHYVDRIVLPYHARAIVYYAGDNDLGRDRVPTPESVLRNFRDFVERVEAAGQAAPVYFVSIKPSPKRMQSWDRMSRANRLVEAFARQHDSITYLDVATPMLDGQGRVRTELFGPDGTHMNERGYALWTSIIRPALQTQVGPNPLYM